MINGLVSVIVPVYNRPQMLGDAVKSVLEQTYRPIEIIIVDDGSIDDTPKVGECLAKEHPNEIIFVRQGNAGPGPAREAGRRLAQGEFIQYLDSDDRLLPRKFDLQVAMLRENAHCGIAYGLTRLIDDAGNELQTSFKWTGRDIQYLFPSLLVDRWWCTHTPLYRRSVTDSIGPWSDLRWSQDWEYDSRAGAMSVRLVNCREYVSEHRHHSGERQTSPASWTTDPVRLRNRVELLALLWTRASCVSISEESPERQHFARWCFSIARRCAAAGLLNDATECLGLAELAAGPRGQARKGLRTYRVLSQVLGATNAGRLTEWAASLRRIPGEQTLPQSFST